MAATDIAVLGIRVTQDGVVTVTNQLNQMTTAAKGAEQATTTLGRSVQNVANSWRPFQANMAQATTGLNAHGLQWGRVNMEMGTAIGRFGDMNSAVTRFAAMLGGATTGYQEFILIQTGILAGVGLWAALTSELNRYAEAQKAATDELGKWFDTYQKGAAGVRQDQVYAAQRQLAANQAQLAALQRSQTSGSTLTGTTQYGAIGVGGNYGQGVVTQQAIDGLQRANAQYKAIIEAGQKDINDTIAKAVNDRAQAYAHDLANLVGSGHATGQELSNLLALVSDYQAQLTRLAQSGGNEELRTNLLQLVSTLQGGIKQLVDSFNVSGGTAGLGFLDNAAKSVERYNYALIPLSRTIQEAATLQNQLNDSTGAIAAIGQKNIEITRKQTDETANAIRKQQEYERAIKDTWTRGLEDLVTNGTQSFSAFFDNVLKMFRRLMDQMQQYGKSSGLGYQLLGIGSAGIAGGFAGYGTGQSSGSYVNGAIGGGIAGAATGFEIAGPFGAVVGGLVGAASGLFGAAEAHKQAAKELQAASDSLRNNVTAFVGAASGSSVQGQLDQLYAQKIALHNQAVAVYNAGGSLSDYRTTSDQINTAYTEQRLKITTDFFADLNTRLNALQGPEGEYLNQLTAIETQYQTDLANAKALGLGQDALDKIEKIRVESEKQLKDAYDATTKAAQQAAIALNQNAQNGFAIRAYNALGNSDAAFALQQKIEMAQAIEQGLSPTTIALLQFTQNAEAASRDHDKAVALEQQQLDALNAQLSALNQQIDNQQQLIAATQKVIDSLQSVRDSLKLNPALTTLSPGQQLTEARQQFQALVAQAMTGDQTAAGNLGGAANTLLGLGKSYYGGTGGYVSLYNDVQAALTGVSDQFGGQLTTEQQMLKQLQGMSGGIAQQIDKQQELIDAENKHWQDMLTAMGAQLVVLLQEVQLLNTLNSYLAGSPTGHDTGPGGVVGIGGGLHLGPQVITRGGQQVTFYPFGSGVTPIVRPTGAPALTTPITNPHIGPGSGVGLGGGLHLGFTAPPSSANSGLSTQQLTQIIQPIVSAIVQTSQAQVKATNQVNQNISIGNSNTRRLAFA